MAILGSRKVFEAIRREDVEATQELVLKVEDNIKDSSGAGLLSVLCRSKFREEDILLMVKCRSNNAITEGRYRHDYAKEGGCRRIYKILFDAKTSYGTSAF